MREVVRPKSARTVVAPRYVARSQVSEKLRNIATRREQVVVQRALAKQHVEHTADASMRKRCVKFIAMFDKEIKELTRLAMQAIAEDSDLQSKHNRLQTIPGVGPVPNVPAILIPTAKCYGRQHGPV